MRILYYAVGLFVFLFATECTSITTLHPATPVEKGETQYNVAPEVIGLPDLCGILGPTFKPTVLINTCVVCLRKALSSPMSDNPSLSDASHRRPAGKAPTNYPNTDGIAPTEFTGALLV